MQPERANSSLQTYLDDGRYRRSTSSTGYYPALSPDLRQSLSLDDVHPRAASGYNGDDNVVAEETRLLLPAIRQARCLSFETPRPKHEVDLLLPGASSGAKFDAKEKSWQPRPSTSRIVQLANAEMHSLMQSLRGSQAEREEKDGSLHPPATREEAEAQLRERNLRRGLHAMGEELRAAKNAHARNAIAKVKNTSPHLFRPSPHKVSGGHGAKQRTFKQRSDDLEAKLNALRWDERRVLALQEDLKKRKTEAICRLYEHGDYVHTNINRLADGHYAYEGQEERMAAMVGEREEKAAQSRLQRRERIVQKKAEIDHNIALRAARKQAYAQERARYEFQQAKANWQRVVLPMALAAIRFVVWSKAIPVGRAKREHEEQVRAANQIRGYYFMVKKAREQRRQMRIRRFVRGRLWWMRLQQRIRTKVRAHDILMPFICDCLRSRQIVTAVRRYIWRIISIQRHVRSILKCRHACLKSYMAQWDKIIMVHKRTQLNQHGGSQKPLGTSLSSAAPAPREDARSHPPPSPAPQPGPIAAPLLLRQKKKKLLFDNINFLLLSWAADPVVEELLKEKLYKHLREYAQELQDWREENKSWQEERVYYEAEIRAREMMMADLKAELEGQRLLDLENKERQDISRNQTASSDEETQQALQEEGGGGSNSMLGAEEEERDVASPLPGGLASPVSLASQDEDNSPISGGASASPSPLAAAKRHKGRKKHGKSGSTSMDASPGSTERWDYASWKAIPAVKRYAHPRYKAEGPPKPIFRTWLHETEEVLPMMLHVRQRQAMA